MKLREHLQDSSMWNALRKMDYHTVRTFVQEPHPNEFAKMLAELLSGIVTEPVKPDIFTEQMFEVKELKTAITRAKLAKAADETGLTAELLRHMPDDICNDLLHCYTCSITCCSQVRCPQLGGKPYSKCYQKR